MDATQAAVQAATDALLRVIDRLLIAGAISQLLLAFAIYFLVLALVRAYRGGGSGAPGVPTQPPGPPAPPVIVQPPVDSHPEISLGATGPAVNELQQILSVAVDGDFGPDTDSAVRAYQATHGLDVDGTVGTDTWAALLANKPAVAQPTGVAISSDIINKILQAAADSNLAHYAWAGRGVAPAGYIKGIAVSYANAYAKWKQGASATAVMAAVASGDGSTDALSWYAAAFSKLGMSNAAAGSDTLRHTFVLLTGLGMRESSGRYCCGRDTSASNETADTAEAGLFQQSWNSRIASPELPKLFAQYTANPQGFLSIFSEGVTPQSGDLTNYGSGDGAAFQALCKSCPDFAVEAAAVGLRTIRQHWGPINRQEAEVRPEADQLFQQVQAIVDAAAAVAPAPPTAPTTPVATTVNGVPAQLAVMRDLVARGVHATHDNPEIMTWPGFIAMKFSNVVGLGAYCSGYVHDSIAWCGLTMAFCMAKAGIMPAFTNGDDLKSFLWAFGWMDSGWGTTIWRWDQGIPISQAKPQMGDILVFDWSYQGDGKRPSGGQGHVTMYDHLSPNDDLFWCSGGNQGNHLCSTSGMAMKNCVAILRPPLPVAT